jgi:sulfate permease, SulP family
VWALVTAFPELNVATTAFGVGTLAILVIGTRLLPSIPLLRRVPAPLLGMVIATAAQAVFHFQDVATIGTAFGGVPRTMPSLGWPEVSLGQALQLIGPAFAIAMLGAIESLLTAVVADGMTNTRHNANQELIGQGIANILAPLFGGFAATEAIARTATNIRNGATSPLAGLVHAAFLILVIVVLAPMASAIPLATLSAILFFVAWNMSDVPHFARLLGRAPRSDKLLLLLTFVLTVFVDLVVAVNAGVVIAALLFMRRMAGSVVVQQQFLGAGPHPGATAATDDATLATLPPDCLVYHIDGPFFFGAAEKLESALERVQLGIRTVVIRLERVPFMDATGMQTLEEIIQRLHKHSVMVILCGVPADLIGSLRRAGIIELTGDRNICSTLQDVYRRLRSDDRGSGRSDPDQKPTPVAEPSRP